MNESVESMKIDHARTGLKLEKRLYLRAQQHASETGRSFAGYVIDLLASDLIGLPETSTIPDIKRIAELRRSFQLVTEPISTAQQSPHNFSPLNPKGRIRQPIDDGRIRDLKASEQVQAKFPAAKKSDKS